jgi:hypothetical protein
MGNSIFKRRAGGQLNMTTLFYKSRSIAHDPLYSFGSTRQVLRTITVPRQYPSSTPSDTLLHFSENTLKKPKPDIGLGNNQFNRP